MDNSFVEYIASYGDTWDTIAFKVYGDSLQYQELMDENRQYASTLVFDGGENLRVSTKIASTVTVASTPFAGSAKISIVPSPWD